MTDRPGADIAILGIFVADATFRAPRQPRMGETILGSGFKLGPGGKGANQAVAAARLGARVDFITMLGRDDFADLALATWAREGINPVVVQREDSYTGAAYIFVDDNSGENAIIVCPGAANDITPATVEAARPAIEGAKVFVTQLEQPVDAALAGLGIARAAGVATILNPAPAAPLDDAMFRLADYLTPNESEAEALTGHPVGNLHEARAAAGILLARGVGTAIITLGENGALFHNRETSVHVPPIEVKEVVETTGAGDAFNGGFAAGLARGLAPIEAARFGCAVAGLSVTRHGAALSMPSCEEAERAFGA